MNLSVRCSVFGQLRIVAMLTRLTKAEDEPSSGSGTESMAESDEHTRGIETLV